MCFYSFWSGYSPLLLKHVAAVNTADNIVVLAVLYYIKFRETQREDKLKKKSLFYLTTIVHYSPAPFLRTFRRSVEGTKLIRQTNREKIAEPICQIK